MTTSQVYSILAEPHGEERISSKTLAYVSEAARDGLYDLVVRSCIESGVTKATLAKRLGKDPAQISRLLGAPGNWTIDTVAELLFAINGAMLDPKSYWPMQKAVSNRRYAACLVDLDPDTSSPAAHFLFAPTMPLATKAPVFSGAYTWRQ